MRRGRRQGVRLAAALGIAALAAAPALASTDISFSAPGAGKDLTDRLRAASLVMTAPKKGDTPAQDLFAAARADYVRLVGALYGAGYYSPIVHIYVNGREAADIAPLDAPATIRSIRIAVTPGPVFRFGSARIAPLAPKTVLPDGFRPGAIAASGVIRDAVDTSITGWRQAGHAKATVQSQKIIADHRTNRLDAGIALDPGPPVTFGKLTISGKSAVRRDRIQAIAGFPTGKPYSPKQMQTVANRLRRTGAFASVALTEAKALGPGDTLDVDAAVVDQKKHRIGFGGEISNSSGATVSAFWLNRNLLGGAEQLRIDGEMDGIGAQTGGVGYKLSFRLDRPATFQPDTAGYLTGTVQRERLTDYSANKLSLGAGLKRIVGDRLVLQYGLGFDAERVTDSSGTTAYRDVNLPLEATWDSRDKPLDAHKGLYLDLGVKPFKGWQGTGSGVRLTFDTRTYRAVGKSVVLAARLQGGSVAGSSLAATPRDYLFYSGGGGTVRGQPYQSLGVNALPSGVRTGGRSFAAISGEIRGMVTQSIGLVAFYDAGYVAAGGLGSKGEWRAGTGLGLRYDTGIGPLRLDLAVPAGGHTGKGLQIYLGIGQAF